MGGKYSEKMMSANRKWAIRSKIKNFALKLKNYRAIIGKYAIFSPRCKAEYPFLKQMVYRRGVFKEKDSNSPDHRPDQKA